MAKAARSAGLARCASQLANGEPHVGLAHRRRALDGEPDQHGAAEVERGEDPEIRSQPQMVDHAGGQQAAEQIGGDVARDVGGKGAGGIGGAGVLAEVGERQREGRRHAEALDDAQQGEERQARHGGEQRGRQRQDREAEQDAAAPVDRATEQGDAEAAQRHADGGGVDREAHGGRRHAIGRGERRQDGLRREQIDDGEERGQPDRERAQDTRHVLAPSITCCGRWGRAGCRTTAAPPASCPRSSTSAQWHGSRARPRPPCAGSAGRSCWHARRSRR